MKPTSHALVSGGVSAGFYFLTQSWPATLVCFLSGIFIDLDHHLDYILARKRIPWRYKDLWEFCSNKGQGKVYLIFHSYELLALLWFSLFYFQLGVGWWGLAIGVTIHIVFDELVNPLKPLGYFFFYRLQHGFDRKKLATEKFWRESR